MWGLSTYILVRELYETFDGGFVSLLGMQYFNQGFSITLISQATNDLLKTVYGLEPGEM